MKVYMRYNIAQDFNIPMLLLAIFCLHAGRANSQELAVSKYGLKVVNTIALYKSIAEKDSLQKMIELGSFVPGIVLDLHYASTNNFMNQRLVS